MIRIENKKYITIIGVNYYPEDTSTGLYTTQMAEYLAKRGHQVTLITGYPYYPQWEIYTNYKNNGYFFEEKINGVKVFRYKQYVPKTPTFIKRLIHLLDFTIGSLRNVIKIKKCDVVICIVPFTSTIVLGRLIRFKTKAKIWTHIQDFEFDAAVESGLVNDKNRIKNYFLSVVFRLEKNLLKNSNLVSTISHGMLTKLKNKTNGETYYLPNWINALDINPETAKTHKYLTSNKFKILYSGNIGGKQDWKFFINFVKKFNNREDIEIILIGNGAKKDWLLNEIIRYNNIKYYPPIPFNDLSDLLCSANLHILFQKTEVVDTVMPSKLLGMMASSIPFLVTGNQNSETEKIINESGGGAYFDPKQFDEIVLFVEMLLLDKAKQKEMGSKARNFVLNKYSYNDVMSSFEKNLIQLCKSP